MADSVARESAPLVPAPVSPFAAQGAGPFGREFRPTNPTQLFVSNAHDGPGKGSVSVYNVDANGALDSIGSSPFPDLQTAPCWVEITHDGQFLFTVNAAVPSISRYPITADGSLTLLGSTPFKSPVCLGPEDARLGPAGGMLWVVDTGLGAVSGFAVKVDNLTELASSPTTLPAEAALFGIVVIYRTSAECAAPVAENELGANRSQLVLCHRFGKRIAAASRPTSRLRRIHIRGYRTDARRAQLKVYRAVTWYFWFVLMAMQDRWAWQAEKQL